MAAWRPHKAPTEPIALLELKYPILGSYKLDGIRCTIKNQIPTSTANKPLPTAWARRYCLPEYEGLDGELVKRDATPGSVGRESNSAVMTQGGMVPLDYYVFDWDMEGPYWKRYEEVTHAIDPDIIVLEQKELRSDNMVLEYEKIALEAGYEGLVLRTPNGRYKHGRCTLKEYNTFKFVRHLTAEAEVIGFYEQMENTNEQVAAPSGGTTRSSHKANKLGKGTLGGVHARNVSDGVLFDIGTGWDNSQRQEIWNNQDKYMGRIAKYKFKPYGVKDKPRQPIWVDWRDPSDMTRW